MNQIRELRQEANKLKPAIRPKDITYYTKLRDNVIISFMPHATNTTQMAEKSWYKQAVKNNNSYLESILYGDIWADLLPGERLGLEHLYYDNPELIDKGTGFYRIIHDYVSAKREGNQNLAQHHLTNALWEVLYNSLPDKSTITSSLPELYYDKTKRRRKVQAGMLNSLNISTFRLPTPDYIVESIRQLYESTPLEVLLSEIVFPLEQNASSIAEEIQQVNAEIQQQIFGKKSIVSESGTKPEATDAFVELSTKIMEDVRHKINTEIDKQAEQGKTEIEIIEHINQTVETYQDTTVPQKMDMLATHFNGKLSELEQREAGYTHYVWRSQDDPKVRPDHAANDGQIFSWDNPPPTGHPGEDYNCRCYAEPAFKDPPIEPVAIENLIPIVALRRIILEGGKRISKAVLKVFKPKPRLRKEYEREVKNISKLEDQLRKKGKPPEEIARVLSKERRDIGQRYKDLTPDKIRNRIRKRNKEKYGDELGPSVDELRKRGKSWEDIIDSAKRPGGKDIF